MILWDPVRANRVKTEASEAAAGINSIVERGMTTGDFRHGHTVTSGVALSVCLSVTMASSAICCDQQSRGAALCFSAKSFGANWYFVLSAVSFFCDGDGFSGKDPCNQRIRRVHHFIWMIGDKDSTKGHFFDIVYDIFLLSSHHLRRCLGGPHLSTARCS